MDSAQTQNPRPPRSAGAPAGADNSIPRRPHIILVVFATNGATCATVLIVFLCSAPGMRLYTDKVFDTDFPTGKLEELLELFRLYRFRDHLIHDCIIAELVFTIPAPHSYLGRI